MDEIRITPSFALAAAEVEITAIRSQGAGGQKVNTSATAAHLRFDIRASSLPEECKVRLLAMHDQRLTGDGVLIIKAQEFRSFEQNREAACARLAAIIREAATVRKKRRPTQPTLASRTRRKESKVRRARTKVLRRKPD
jgi:ribosome-associated protein